MAKAKIIVRNSPYIKNAHLIGAGNKFPSLRDAGGNIQWRASVSLQAAPKVDISALKAKMQQAIKPTNTNKSITPKMVHRPPSL